MTPNNRRGPDDMEIDALTKKGKGYRGKGKNKKPMDRRRLAWCADVLAAWPKIAGSRKRTRTVYPTTRAGKAKAKERTV